MKTRSFRAVALVVLPLLAACTAGGAGTRRTPTPEVRLEVHNNLVPPRSVTVRVIAAAGGRSLLGSVSPAQTAVLEYEQPGFQGQYHFVAEIDGGQTIRSSPVLLADGSRLVWRLQTNTLQEMD